MTKIIIRGGQNPSLISSLVLASMGGEPNECH